MNPLQILYEDMVRQGMTPEQWMAALLQHQSSQSQQPNTASNLNVATGSAFSDAIMQMLLGILSGKLSASELAGYLPGDLLGMQGTLPTLARQEFQTGTMFDLANLMGNPRDAGQLQQLSQLAGSGDPFATAQATGTPLTGEGWQTLINNLTGLTKAPAPVPAPPAAPVATPAAPTSITQRALDRYAGSTAGEKAALAKATPEQLARLWAGGTAGMAQGGQLRINEPSVILGLLSQRPYATLGEGGKPEDVKISPVRQFAQGGNVNVRSATNSRYASPNAFTTKSRAKLGGYKGRMQDLTPQQRTTAGVGQAGEGSTAWQKLQLGYTPTPATPTTPAAGVGTTSAVNTPAPAFQLTSQAPASAGALAALLQQMLVPTPGAINQTLYSRLLPYQLEGLLGGASGAGMPPESYLAQMQKYWHSAPSYSTVRYGW